MLAKEKKSSQKEKKNSLFQFFQSYRDFSAVKAAKESSGSTDRGPKDKILDSQQAMVTIQNKLTREKKFS